MKSLFHVKNTTGETWPAFGMARLGDITRYDGVNADVPLYELVKPDGESGIYIVNGASPLLNDREGTASHYIDAQYVAVKSSESADVGTAIGAIDGEWTAGSDEGNGGQFNSTDEKNTANIIPVVAISTGGGGASSNPTGCPCTCISDGDIVVNGVATTSQWKIPLTQQAFRQTHGVITVPAGLYYVVYSSVDNKWKADIGDVLTAAYTSGDDATEATTMDGTLTMAFDSYGVPFIELCIDGTVPEQA